MVKVIWTEFALADLKSIHEYISKDSKVYADKLVEKLISRVEQLEQFPKSGKTVSEFDSDSIRELTEGSYRIVYKIYSDHVGVIRIHHSARQLK